MASKKSKPKKKPHKSKKAKQLHPFVRLMKWCVVLGLWGMIGLGLILAWYAADLPNITDSPQFEHRTSMTIKAADGSQLIRYGEMKGETIAIEDIPSNLIYAIIATEDRRFYTHYGVDPIGIARAMATNVKAGRTVQGGSTITQQLAKNLFLSHERTLKRKIQEAMLALWLEHELTKDEILSAYLNRVYLGSGAYGVEAAAQLYFNKSVSQLSLQESAVIAGLLKAPSRYSPLNSPSRARARAKVVLRNMANAGYITDNQAQHMGKVVTATIQKPKKANTARYFTDWVSDQIYDLIGAPTDNIVVYTTLQPGIQKRAENALVQTLLAYGDQRKIEQGAILSMDTQGAIVAMVGGVDYRKSQFNRATQARRAPGSAFKPVVYLTALNKGWNPEDTVLDAPIEGEYSPKNFDDEYDGDITLEHALAHSLNTAAVRLAAKVGIGNVIKTAKNLGITSKLQPDLSLALGSSGVSALEMTSAYATLANDGRLVTPYAITRIESADGEKVYYEHARKTGRRAVDRSDARKMTMMLRSAINNGTGRKANLPFPAAGKTGTSQLSRDAWFIGYTDKIATSVWLGNDDNTPMSYVTGGSFPALIWREVMFNAEKDYKTPEKPRRSFKWGLSGLIKRITGSSEDEPRYNE